MTAELTVGIDIGTTSVKAVAADGDGTVVARARVPHRLLVPAPDQLEHDAVEAWAEGPAKALAEAAGERCGKSPVPYSFRGSEPSR